VLGSLYGSEQNFRVQKVLVAARYSGKSIDLKEDFDPKLVANQFALGKTPALEVTDSSWIEASLE